MHCLHNHWHRLFNKSLSGRMIWQIIYVILEDFEIASNDLMPDDNYIKNDLHSIGKELIDKTNVFGAWNMSYIKNVTTSRGNTH